jgi:transcriptional regulator with XRE-family HTH domain
MADSSAAIASLIWAEIAASGRTQADVCTAVGITQKHMSRFVTGKTGMSLDLVDAILADLGRELVLSTRVKTTKEGDSL